MRIFNAEATPEDIEDIPIFGGVEVEVCRNEDNVVHQAFHGHVETVGISQDLKVFVINYERKVTVSSFVGKDWI